MSDALKSAHVDRLGPPARSSTGGFVRENLLVAGLFVLLHLTFVSAGEPGPGLRVSAEGRFERGGHPIRALGVNYYDLFVRSLEVPPRPVPSEGLAQLRTLGIPFARFSAGGYWPSDWGLYRTNRAEYFARLDAVVRLAESEKIGLIPSLFWYLPTLPDLVGEPVSSWGDPTSQTIAFMRDYTRQVVRRYRDSPAIWGWEFGNEYNLPADLPNAADHRPAVVPGLGTASVRSAKDEVTHDQIRIALREFGREVRRWDPGRALFSGNAFPRPSAWHQKTSRSWAADSEEQWATMLDGDNPDPINSFTGRLYSKEDRSALPWAHLAAQRVKKPVFVGEFGVPRNSAADPAAEFPALVEALEQNGVSLAALWVYDFDGQAADWNVTSSNDRRSQLEAIATVNRRWNSPKP